MNDGSEGKRDVLSKLGKGKVEANRQKGDRETTNRHIRHAHNSRQKALPRVQLFSKRAARAYPQSAGNTNIHLACTNDLHAICVGTCIQCLRRVLE